MMTGDEYMEQRQGVDARLWNLKMMTSYVVPMHGRPQKFFQRGGQNQHYFKKLTIFRRAEGANENLCVFLRRFRVKYRVSMASAKGASDNVRVFCRTSAYYTIFSNSGGGASAPPSCGRPCSHVKYP